MNLDRLANIALFVNLGWYVTLCALFGLAGNVGKAIYFLGAAILTVGVIIL